MDAEIFTWLIGHGGPPALFAQTRVKICTCSLLLILWSGIDCAPAFADTDLRLHIAWGGGQERVWNGRLILNEGRMGDLRLLGLDADEPGSIVQKGQQVLIKQRRPRNYDAFELTVSAPKTAKLRMELLPVGEVQAKTIEVPIEELISGFRSEPLDDNQNRLVVRRAPGDFVRLRFQRDHLVFAPEEAFMLDVEPHELLVPPRSNVRCAMRLCEARTGEVVWEENRVLNADAFGKIPTWERCIIPIPDREGVYDLQISLANRRQLAPLAGDKTLAKRNLQFVVVDKKSPLDLEGQARSLVLDLDPTQKNWWQRLTRLPQWTLIPGLRSEGPLGNHKADRIIEGSRTWTQIAPAGWQAYPLPIDEVGQPHELEIDFPGDREQTFVVSVIEPNAAGKVMPVGLDSGIHVSPQDVTHVAVQPEEVQQHRLVFWPKTTAPLVLVTNLRQEQPAVFGNLRVYRQGSMPDVTSAKTDSRLAFAYFERPYFPECFGASEFRDPETGRSLEDWVTFYEGGRRMIRHLKQNGYTGVVLTCFSEGSTLYPSPLLQPTPKHDRGVFFASGQDALRKDVLEMLFRLCDREGIQLVPALEFSTPLPSLEKRRLQSAEAMAGVDLVDEDDMLWVNRNGSDRGRAPYYNPVNETVQEAMLAVVREIAARYGKHRSFGGISITMTPAGYSQLPDADWGNDVHTLKQFQAEADAEVKAMRVGALRTATQNGPLRNAWLEWRARRLTDFYGRMARELRQIQPAASLYLASGRLTNSKPVQRAFRPALPRQINVGQAMKELGLDAEQLDKQTGVIFLRPKLQSWNPTLTQSGSEIEFNSSQEVEDYFKSSVAGTHFLHDPYRARLPSFDAMSPFGSENTLLSLVAQISVVGHAYRRPLVEAMAAQDSRVIFSGGWMMPLGQEEFARRFLNVFRSLPNEPFEEALKNSKSSQPLRIRRLVKNGSTYFYVVNESPWQVNATLALGADNPVRVQSLGQARVEAWQQTGEQIEWNLNLLPYDLVAIKVNDVVTFNNLSVELPEDVLPALKTRVDSLISRASRLRHPPSLKLLSNASFEEPVTDSQAIPGWTADRAQSAVKILQGDAFDGQSFLRVKTDRNTVVLYSAPFMPPASKRLSVAIRAKAGESNQQPQVRMILRAGGKTYYPWSGIGGGHIDRGLNNEWKEFVFRVSQLPPIGPDLQIGIEVTGRGEVFLDDVQLFDILALDDEEVSELATLMTFMNYLRENGMVSDCLRSLNGYWPQYLMKNVPDDVPAVANKPQPTVEVAPLESDGSWDRLRQFVPRFIR